MATRKRIRGVLFDWDGTLLDSFDCDLRAYLEMFSRLDIPWGEAELRRHYSPNWHRVYEAAGLPRARWEEADRVWRSAYRHLSPPLLPGARRVLHELRRSYQLGLVTSGNRIRVSSQLGKFGFARLFAARVFGEESGRRKPHRDPLERALRILQLDPGECVYVGDSPEDVRMARGAGVRAIAVLGPFPTHARLIAARPDAILDSVMELSRWLACNTSSWKDGRAYWGAGGL
jgi:HAD superfamily hydrolase (TIGR01509 family)